MSARWHWESGQSGVFGIKAGGDKRTHRKAGGKAQIYQNSWESYSLGLRQDRGFESVSAVGRHDGRKVETIKADA